MSSRIFFNPYFFITVGSATSLGAVEWVARQTSAGATDRPYSIATDSTGNVYICGQYSNTLTAWNANGTAFGTTLAIATSTDCFLIKYNSSGNVQWVTRQTTAGSTDQSRSVKTDSTGNVYIAGYHGSTLTAWNANGTAFGTTLAINTSLDGFLIKYDTNGNVLWVTRQTTSSSETTFTVNVDNSGNVYVSGQYGTTTLTAWNANGTAFGTTLTGTAASNSFIVKYNTNGNVLWVARISNPTTSGTNRIYGVSTDQSGNVYISGEYTFSGDTAYNSNGTAFGTTLARVSATSDAYFIKYDTTGNVNWVTRQTTAGGSFTYASPIGGTDSDSSGNVYVCGYYSNNILRAFNSNGTQFGTTLPTVSNVVGFLVKYDTNGNVLWIARQQNTSNMTPNGVKTDSSGNVYITGIYQNGNMPVYNANGTQFGSILDPVVTGTSNGFIVKYDTNGNVLWVSRQQGGAGNIQSLGINIDSSGNVYSCGQYTATLIAYRSDGTQFGTTLAVVTSIDSYIIKYGTQPLPPYSAIGAVQWVTRITSSGGSDGITNTFTDSTGNVYISGQYSATLTAFNSNGTAFGTTLAIVTSTDCFLIKYNTNGNVLWVARQTSSASDQSFGGAIDTSGNVYVSGYYANAIFTAWNSNGTAFGTTLSNSGSTENLFLIKYNTNGNVVWVARQYGGANIPRVSTDTSGNVYVGGNYGFNNSSFLAFNSNSTQFGTTLAVTTSRDCFLIKYDTNGNVQWLTRQTSASTNDGTSRVETDSSGNVYIAGQYGFSGALTAWNSNGTAFGTTLPSVSNASFLIKYNTNGDVLWVARQSGPQISSTIFGLSRDTLDNVYIAGTYNAPISDTFTMYNANGTAFGTTLTHPSGNTNIAFTVKYNSSGVVQWIARQQCNVNTSSGPNNIITEATTNNIYIVGFYTTNILIAYNSNATAFGTQLTGAGSTNNAGYIVKYDTNGNVLWVASCRSTGSTTLGAISIDNTISKCIYVSGSTTAALTAYNSTTISFGTTITTAPTMYLVKYA